VGDELFEAATSMDDDRDLRAFLHSWRNDLRSELLSDAHHHLHMDQAAFARRVSPYFPSVKMLHLYMSPVNSATTGVALDRSLWVLRNINTRKIIQLCGLFFTWGTFEGICKKFVDVLWAGAIFRQLLQVRFTS